VFTETPPKKLESAFFNRLAYQKKGWEVAVKLGRMNVAWSWIRFYEKKKKRFPWGLKNKAIEILEQFKKQYGESYKFEGDGITDIGITTCDGIGYYKEIKGLRPYQVDAINKLISEDGGILAMPTGSGKTRTTIEFLKKANFGRALVVVTTVDLKNQWKEQVVNMNWNVEVKTYQSLISKNNKIDLNAYDIVIFDECHHVSANTLFKIAMNCNRATLIGLSATPYRAYKPETMKIIAAVGEIVYSISLRELITQGYLCDAEIRVIENLEQECKVEYWDNYNDVVNKFIVNNKVRNRRIYFYAYALSAEGTVLILVDKIKHGEKILNELKLYIHKEYLGDDTENKIVFVHGSSKNRKQIFEDVKKGKYDIVIASKIYGEGVDIPNLTSLILAGGGKSSVKIIQQIGRLLRLFPGKSKAIIYDFNDDVKYLKKHFEARYETYKDLFEVKFI